MILLIQWKAAYTVIAEYKTLASGGTWDNEKGADINDKDPASKAFWEGYTKSPVSPFNIYIIIISYLALKEYKALQGLQTSG